jgi:hypothetical protein
MAPGYQRPCRLTIYLLTALVLLFVLCILFFNHGFLLTLIIGVPLGSFTTASTPNPAAVQSNTSDVITIVTIFKNEGLSMREWIEHHLALGVDSFLLFDDTAPDDPYPSHKILEPYIRRGQVELVPMLGWDNRLFFLSSAWSVPLSDFWLQPPLNLFFHSKQQRVITAAWRRLLTRASPHQYHWLALLDLDEFYNPHGQDIKCRLRDARLRGARTVRMGKLDFGPSGVVQRPEDGMHRPHYIYRDAVPERLASITLVNSITGMAPYCVHTFEVSSIVGEVLFSGGIDCNCWPGNQVSRELRRHIYYAAPDELAVHHYKTKSLEECCEHQRVIPVNSPHMKNRNCRPDAMSAVCDDSLLQYVPGHEYRRPCATEPSSFAAASRMSASRRAVSAVEVPPTAPPAPRTPFYLFCDRLMEEIEVERAVAVRLRETKARLEHRGQEMEAPGA